MTSRSTRRMAGGETRRERIKTWLLCAAALMIALPAARGADVRVAGPAMSVPPGSSVTALPDGRILIFGGANTSLWNPVARHWETDMVANQQTRRSHHTATLDGAGHLIITGGVDIADYRGRQNALNSTTVWNIDARSWESGPGLIEPRLAHAAVALKSHELLVTGGSSSADRALPVAPMLAGAELIGDKTTVNVKPMSVARAQHAAVLLADGRVLVTGGIGNDTAPLRSTEIYDPADKNWSRGPDLRTARSAHTASLLPDGRVLVTGGIDAQGLPVSAAEIWTPGDAQWRNAGNLLQPRSRHDAIVLPSGEVLLSGGEIRAQQPAQSLELWRPGDASWHGAGQLPLQLRDAHTLLASNGRILIFGRDPYAGNALLTWLPDAQDDPSVFAPMDGVLTAMKDGRFMLTGGYRRQADSAAVHIYDPVSRQWSTAEPLHHQRRGHRALSLRDGRVLVLGGRIDGQEPRGVDEQAPSIAAELWNPATGRWELSRSLSYPPGSWQEPSLLSDGRVALTGLDNQNAYADVLGYVRVWNPADDALSEMTKLARPWRSGHGLLLSDGSIVYAGGEAENGRRIDAWNPLGGGWQPLPVAPANLTDLQFQALTDGGFVAWSQPRNAGEANQPLLRWHPQSGWQSLPTPTAVPAGQPLQAFALPRGDLLVMAGGKDSWVWNRLNQTWTRIAHEKFWGDALLVAARPDGSVLGFHAMNIGDSSFPRFDASRLNITAGRWQPDGGEYVPRDHPTLVDLGDGRVMVTGGDTRVVQLWHAARNEWQFTGFLPRPLKSASAKRLADGRVMLAGIGEEGVGNALFCELWDPASGNWNECGKFIVDAPESGYPTVLRPLDRQRVLLVHGKQHALLWNEKEGWTATKLQMPADQSLPTIPPAGAPFLAPIASVWDPLGNSWIDATDVFFINSMRLRATTLRDGSILAIAGAGTLYKWDPAAKTLSRLSPQPMPEDSGLNALVETAPGCIAAWNDRQQQNLSMYVQAALPTLYAGNLKAGRWTGNPDIALTPLNASGIGLADGTVLIAGNSLLPAAAGDAVQRFRADCDGVKTLDRDGRIYLPTAAIAPPAATQPAASASVKPFQPPPFPQRWVNEVRSQFWDLPKLWVLKVLAAMAVLWPLRRFLERWETYVNDDEGRSPGRRADSIIVAAAVPVWIALVGLPHHGLKTLACLALAIAVFISARRLWLNAPDARHKGFLALPLAGAWFIALATIGSVFTSGVTRWFSVLTDYS